jgi:hypothetical protein
LEISKNFSLQNFQIFRARSHHEREEREQHVARQSRRCSPMSDARLTLQAKSRRASACRSAEQMLAYVSEQMLACV